MSTKCGIGKKTNPLTIVSRICFFVWWELKANAEYCILPILAPAGFKLQTGFTQSFSQFLFKWFVIICNVRKDQSNALLACRIQRHNADVCIVQKRVECCWHELIFFACRIQICVTIVVIRDSFFPSKRRESLASVDHFHDQNHLSFKIRVFAVKIIYEKQLKINYFYNFFEEIIEKAFNLLKLLTKV